MPAVAIRLPVSKMSPQERFALLTFEICRGPQTLMEIEDAFPRTFCTTNELYGVLRRLIEHKLIETRNNIFPTNNATVLRLTRTGRKTLRTLLRAEEREHNPTVKKFLSHFAAKYSRFSPAQIEYALVHHPEVFAKH